MPAYVTKEFDEYLKCGRLEHGFLRVRCESVNLHAVSVQHETIISYGRVAQGAKGIAHGVFTAIAESEKIHISGRAIWLVMLLSIPDKAV